jgi:hypothetical protein
MMGPADGVPIAMEQPPPPLQGVVIVQWHLIVTVDGRHRLALSLAGVRADARYTQTIGYIRPIDLYTSRLIALLPCSNSDLVQGGQLLQQPTPYRLVGAQGGIARWRRGEAGRGRIRTQLP